MYHSEMTTVAGTSRTGDVARRPGDLVLEQLMHLMGYLLHTTHSGSLFTTHPRNQTHTNPTHSTAIKHTALHCNQTLQSNTLHCNQSHNNASPIIRHQQVRTRITPTCEHYTTQRTHMNPAISSSSPSSVGAGNCRCCIAWTSLDSSRPRLLICCSILF